MPSWVDDLSNAIVAKFVLLIDFALSDPLEQRACLELLAALTAEFNPPTASALDQPWSWHDRARLSFERDALMPIALCALRRAQAASAKLVSDDSHPSDSTLAAAALVLLSSILNWEFRSGRDAMLIQVSGQLGDRPGEEDGRRGGRALSPDLYHALAAPGALDWAAALGSRLTR